MPCCGINGQATIPNPSVSAFPLYHHPRTHTTQRRAAAAVVLEASKHAVNERVTSLVPRPGSWHYKAEEEDNSTTSGLNAELYVIDKLNS